MLVLTLMIITLFLTFILVQFTQITNTSRQVETMEKNIEARLIAEMGVDYYRKLVKSTVSETVANSDDIILPDLREQQILDDKGNYKYEISNPEIVEESSEQVKISFTSKGTALDTVQYIENTTITINLLTE
ncbi:hypothetical protein [Virgibacillus byunsanensis]